MFSIVLVNSVIFVFVFIFICIFIISSANIGEKGYQKCGRKSGDNSGGLPHFLKPPLCLRGQTTNRADFSSAPP